MSTVSIQQQAPARVLRPKLSLTTCMATASRKSSVSYTAALTQPLSPTALTALNTLSNKNVMVSSPQTSSLVNSDSSSYQPESAVPITAINTKVQTPYITTAYPETPMTCRQISPAAPLTAVCFPNAMAFTPPLSAGPVEQRSVFSFTDASKAYPKLSLNTQINNTSISHSSLQPSPPLYPRRVSADDVSSASLNPHASHHVRTGSLPYTHPRTLHSILRNSPLPSTAQFQPAQCTERRPSKTPKHVGYNSPLEQTIVNQKYTISHIDLLNGDFSPSSPAPNMLGSFACDTPVDPFTSNETRNGGMTPGPFEEMRRRIAGLAAVSTPAVNKRMPPTSAADTATTPIVTRRREKKRQWRWTIGQDDETDVAEDEISGALVALRAAEEQAQKKARTLIEVTNTTTEDSNESQSFATIEPTASCPLATPVQLPVPVPRKKCSATTDIPTKLCLITSTASLSVPMLIGVNDTEMSDASSNYSVFESPSVAGVDTDTDLDTEGDSGSEMDDKTPVAWERAYSEESEEQLWSRRQDGPLIIPALLS